MSWPELVVDFPTLFVAVDWIGAHCVVPDGFQRGESFEPVDWQAWSYLNWYRVKPEAQVGQLATAFFYRRSQIVLPQKAGKAPYSAGHICNEGVGPALFAGWAEGGELYDCRDHGCGCGWLYEYQPGEAMGQPWPTPLVQITATSEDQTDNIYDALRPMIDLGPLSVLIPKTGEEFIRLPHGGRIDVVTSNATSRLGQRVTFVPQDQTESYTETNRMIKVAETQRRGAAGMGGRVEETGNAWDPNVDSQARRTAKAAESSLDIFRLHPMAPRGLKYTVRDERRKIHRYVYRGSRWVDLDAIEGEAAEILKHDPGQAERFFGNNPVAGIGLAFDREQWDKLAKPREVPRGSVITIGIDGASHDDALAVVAVDVKSGYTWPLIDPIERPENAPDDYKHDLDVAEGAVVDAAERYVVWRVYADPQYIAELVKSLQNKLGKKRVIEWMTYRPRPIAWAVRNFVVGVSDAGFRHDGNPVLGRHIENAHKMPLTVLDDKEQPMYSLCKEHPHSEKKIDGSMGCVLAHEARRDCIAAGGVWMGDDPEPQPDSHGPAPWSPGVAPRAEWFRPREQVGPMGTLS